MQAPVPDPVHDAAALESRFDALHAASRASPQVDAATRARRLAHLEALLHEGADALAQAISADFGHRSRDESRLIELFPAIEAVRHARRNVGRWMQPQRRRVGLWFQPGRAQVMFQPLGVVGIVVPWNYPVLLAAAPLAGALAAGNRAMVKMSELAPATAACFARLARERFGADEIDVVEGDAQVAQRFVALAFDHLLFTGSTPVGASVMRAAAAQLTPVTLELGGKSPVIVAPDYPLGHAAERIVIGKMINAGQTCIAPDYALVAKGSEDEFVAALRQAVARCYPRLADNPDYATIVNARHFARLQGYVDEARGHGARVVELAPGTAPDPGARRFPPLALLGAHDALRVMREEIFGPILPVVPVDGVDAAIDYVNARPRPLALYVFDRDAARVQRVLERTVAGGVTVNDTLLHIAQEALPFGGVGPSGMGHYHGREGFETFSKKKAVFYQSRLSGVGLVRPPYGERFRRMLRLMLGTR